MNEAASDSPVSVVAEFERGRPNLLVRQDPPEKTRLFGLRMPPPAWSSFWSHCRYALASPWPRMRLRFAGLLAGIIGGIVVGSAQWIGNERERPGGGFDGDCRRAD